MNSSDSDKALRYILVRSESDGNDEENMDENRSPAITVGEDPEEIERQPIDFELKQFDDEPQEEKSEILSPSPSAASEGLPRSLHQIAREGDVAILRALPPEKIKDLCKHINDLDDKHLTPLHYSARYSHLATIDFLLDNGAEVNKKGDDGMTPLHYAARYSKKASNHALKALRQFVRRSSILNDVSGDNGEGGAKNLQPSASPSRKSLSSTDDPDYSIVSNTSDAVIKMLIEHGADVNAKDRYRLTALHHAAMRGHVTAINRLLATPDIERQPRDAQNSTPLHLASTYNHLAATRLLLDNGSDPRCRDSDQRTPLHEACLEGNTDIASLLIEKCKEKFGEDYTRAMLGDKDEEGNTPLLLGVASGKSALVKFLINEKANVNTTNNTLVYPVHAAARTGDLQTLEILIQNNARLDCVNALMQTPLYLAAQNNHVDIIKALIESGASIDLWDSEGITPLVAAACEGHVESVEVLMDLGARLDTVDKNEKSALYYAAEQNYPEVISVLLRTSRGRELIALNDQYDNQPIHIAAAEGNVECVRLLIENGAEIDNKNEDEQTPIHLAAIFGRPKVVDLICRKDPSAINDVDEDGNTPLHLACSNKRKFVAEMLLERGADVQSRNNKKWTPLDCAAAAGSLHCVKLLLENDAPIDAIDRTKTTPLHLAAESGHDKIILLLLEYGADITCEDTYGRNMLELAILSRKRNVVKTVLQHKDWRKALRTTFTVSDKHGSPVPETPMRLLIRIYPDLAEMVFDQCITVEKSEKDHSIPKSTMIWRAGAKIKMDYEFIDDAFHYERNEASHHSDKVKFKYCPVDEEDNLDKYRYPYDPNAKVVMDNHPLMIMAEKQHKNLLRHPLCLGLVRHKWKTFGRYMFYGNLLAYSLFLACLTTYIVVAPNPSVHDGQACSLPSNSSFILRHGKKALPSRSDVQMVCQLGIFVLVGLNLLRELVQLYRAGRRYFQWTNLFDWGVYVLSFLLVFDFSKYSFNSGLRECWQWELGAIVVVLAWLNLLGDIRQLPFLGIYVIMFFDILKTFLKFVIVFLIFLIAFALGFHTLLITRDQGPFNSFGYSLLKTSVMMLGEVEFDSLFFPDDKGYLPFEAATVILFVVFLVVMAIIIVNLLIGLAVDDIKAVQEQAVLKRLAMQVELVLDVERLLPTYFVRMASSQCEVIERKRRHWWSIFTDVVSSRSIVKDVTGIKHVIGLEDIVERQDVFEDSLDQIKTDLKLVLQENQRLKQILVAMVEHSGVSLDNDEEF